MKKRTVVVGASPNPYRYAYMATQRLLQHNHEVVPLGVHTGQIFNLEILDLRKKPQLTDVDTLTMYIAPIHQPEWIDYLVSLTPRRIIFNPGSENTDFVKIGHSKNIEIVEGCTLVMLSTGTY